MTKHDTTIAISKFESLGPLKSLIPDTAGGKIHILGLEAIKVRVGEKWNKMSGLVHRYFEAAIRHELKQGDTYCHADELNYLILFNDASVTEANVRCRAIIERAATRLFGDEGKDLMVRSVVAPIAMLPSDLASHRSQFDMHLEASGVEQLIKCDSGQSVSDDCSLLRLQAVNSPLIRTIPKQGTSFIYRPLWDSAKGAILVYLCQPTVLGSHRSDEPIEFYQAVGCDGAQLELDTIILRECATRLSNLRKSGQRVLLAVPVHFDTVQRSKSWTSYRESCKTIGNDLLADLIFVVYGIDVGVPNIRLIQEIPKLVTLGRRVFCVSNDTTSVAQQFQGCTAHAIGMVFDSKTKHHDPHTQVQALARSAQQLGVASFLLGVNKTSVASFVVGAGIRYLEGSSVRPASSDPKYAVVQEIEDLYRNHRRIS